MTALAETHPTNGPAARSRPVLQALLLFGALAILAPIAVALPATLLEGRPLPWQFDVAWVSPHVAAALLLLVLGALQLGLRKGDRRHRMIGYAWCALMAFVSVSGLFIRLQPGPMTIIHIASSVFSVINLVCIPLVIWGARTGRRRLHEVVTLAMFANLIFSALLTFIPFRAIGLLVFGALH